MVKEKFIDFLTEKETLNKFKTNDRGQKFRKATPIQIAAVILCVLKNKQEGKYYYGDVVQRVMTHRVIFDTLKKFTETDIELHGKDAQLTAKTVYSILYGFKFFDQNKTKDRYVFNGQQHLKSEIGKKYNNWRITEKELCEFLGWDETIYEEDDEISMEERIEQLEEKVAEQAQKIEEIETVIENFTTTDDEVTAIAIEVLKNLHNADAEQIQEWHLYTINALKYNGITKRSKETVAAIIKTIEEYENDNR